jgi:glyoxylase-like metal-dependent hydrolase (beta-lactamase superfamily II)
MEIVPGIHQVDGVRGANSYLVTGDAGILLVDTGLPRNGKKIVDYLRGLGRKPDSIKYIVLTHADIDHSGSAAELKEITGASVAIHASDAPRLTGGRQIKEVRGILGLLFRAMPALMHFRPVKPDISLRDGEEIVGFTVIYTPGHTSGSICLYRSKDVLFAGDALRSDKSGNPKLPSKMMSLDIVQATASLAKLAKLDFEALLVGHGTPVLGNASNKVKHLLQSRGSSEPTG